MLSVKWERFFDGEDDEKSSQQAVCDFINEHPGIQIVGMTEFSFPETDQQVFSRGYTLFYREEDK